MRTVDCCMPIAETHSSHGSPPVSIEISKVIVVSFCPISTSAVSSLSAYSVIMSISSGDIDRFCPVRDNTAGRDMSHSVRKNLRTGAVALASVCPASSAPLPAPGAIAAAVTATAMPPAAFANPVFIIGWGSNDPLR